MPRRTPTAPVLYLNTRANPDHNQATAQLLGQLESALATIATAART